MAAAPREVITGAHWGVYYAQVVEDRVVGVRPFELDPHPSSMIQSMPDVVHSAARITQPMVRAGFLKKRHKSDSRARGGEPFVAVSWERALDLVRDELTRVRTEFGNESIFAGSYGWASAGRFHVAQKQMHRFLNLIGGFSFHKGNYSAGAAFYIVPYTVGDPWIIFSPTSWPSIEQHTDLVVAFGGVPLKNTQADQGGVGVHDTPGWLERIKKAGVEFVYVGPLADDMGPKLDARWLASRPNTDTAMMLGLAHTLYVEALWDRAFIDKYSVGFERFLPYLLGETDGVPKDADWAAAVTEIPAQDIRLLARRMAAGRTMLNVSLSVQRADHGEQPYWMAMVLAAMLGQIGLPGGGFGYGYGAAAGAGVPRTPIPAPDFSIGANAVRRFIPVARISDALLNPGASVECNGETLIYPDIRLMWWAGGNPFHHHQDLNKLLRAWQKAETVIVNDSWWTAVARHADIVLPATTSLERNDIGSANFATDRFLFAMQQAVPPQHQARNEFDIFSDLADRFGVRDAFTEGRDEAQWLRHMYDQSRAVCAKTGIELPTFEAFWEKGYHEVPAPKEPLVALADFRGDPLGHRLKTPSGRLEIFSDKIASYGYDDCPGHPTWIEPAEWLGSPMARKFPLHLVSNQPRGRLHGQLDQGSVSQAAKVAGREPIWINPRDAAARKVSSGNVVRVFNDRGACLAGAVVTDQIRPGVVQISTGAWYNPAEPGVVGSLDKHGNPNVLTLDKGSSKLAQAPISQTTLVEVEKFNGKPPPVSAFELPEIIQEADLGVAT